MKSVCDHLLTSSSRKTIFPILLCLPWICCEWMRFCATQQMQPFRLLFNTTIKVHLNIAHKLFISQCIHFPRQYHYSNSSDNAAAHLILAHRLALFVNFVSRILCSMFVLLKKRTENHPLCISRTSLDILVYLLFRYNYNPRWFLQLQARFTNVVISRRPSPQL